MLDWLIIKLIDKFQNERIDLSEFALSTEALKHSKSYSDLLNIYVRATKRNTIIKDILKILFFVITMGALITIVVVFCITLNSAYNLLKNLEDINTISIEAILSVATIVIPAISSLIVAFIKIPKIIAKYLFNVQEENYMDSIIKNIQNHDQSMFAMEHKINVVLAENKGDVPDDEFEKSPKGGKGVNNKTA